MEPIEFNPKIVQRFKDERRCMKCRRRTFEDLIICERCREFQYCCIECLEGDRGNHRDICDKIGFKKGILLLMDHHERERYHEIKLKARFLDENGDVRTKTSNKTNEEEISKASNGQQSVPEKKESTNTHGKNFLSEGLGNVQIPDQKRKNKKNKSYRKRAKKESGKKDANVSSENDGKSAASADQRSVLENLSSGRFGGPVRCSNDDVSGTSFGKDWFKLKPVATVKSKVKSKPNVLKSTGPTRKAKMQTSAELYGEFSDDEEEKDEVKGKTQETEHRGCKKGQDSGGAEASGGDPEIELTGKEVMVYDEEKAEAEAKRVREKGKPVVIRKCYKCEKRSFNLKTCGRCQIAVYCDTVCQKGDFEAHKEICKRIVRFTTARKKVPWGVRHVGFFGMSVPLEISPDLNDVLMPFAPMIEKLLKQTAVLVEIIASIPHPIHHEIRVRDLKGKQATVVFLQDIYYHFVGGLFKIPMRVDQCLKPGNFLLLLHPSFEIFMGGTVGIPVEDSDDVHIIFMK